jgi:type I restriction enzyme, S subunit
VLKTTAIQAGAFLPEHNKHLPKHLEPRPQIEVNAGDILITCAGPRARCGVACLVRSTRPRLMMSGKMYRFRVPSEYVDARFLEAYLLTPNATTAIDKMKTGGSDSGLNLTHDRFRPLPVPVAPSGEQRRIMDEVEELLSDLDAGVAALQRVRAKLKYYRNAVLNAAVEGALTDEWRSHHPAAEPATGLLTRILDERRGLWEKAQLKRFKAAGKHPPKHWKTRYPEPISPDTANLPSLPQGWHWASIDHLLQPQAEGKVLHQGWSPQCEKVPATSENEWGVLKTTAIQAGAFLPEHNKRLPSHLSPEARIEVAVGDVIMTCAGPRARCGVACLVRQTRRRLMLSGKMYRFRTFPNYISPAYLEIFLLAPYAVATIDRMKTGGSDSGLNLTQERFLPLPIAVPPISEQLAIVEAVDDQLSVINHLESDLEIKLKDAQTLRQSVLRHAFTGQLVPQDPNDEPANELLKRIAAEREERARLARAVKDTKRKTKVPRTRATTT